MTAATTREKLRPADYASDQEVRWCPGCGDYAILKCVRNTLADIGARRENTVFVSGIGCSSRLPYYMSTYGFHTIHGRAPAFATGVKLANPALDVWLITGDGDGLSIGGNHLLHALRRNVDMQILLFNNEIYGLTKGQFSPTSRLGTRSPSTPGGSIDAPLSPCAFALGAGARFVARGVDTAIGPLAGVLAAAHANKGASFVEIYQNCIVYNDNVFADFTGRPVADERQLHVEHGKPLLFGKAHDKGLALDIDAMALKVVELGEDGAEDAGVLVHNRANRALATLLATMDGPEFPVALGVLYADPAPSYEAAVAGRAAAASDAAGWNEILRRGHTWRIENGAAAG